MKRIKNMVLESFTINERNELDFTKSKALKKLKTIKEFDDSQKLDGILKKDMYGKNWNPKDFTYTLKDLENTITDASRRAGFQTSFDMFYDNKNHVIVLKSKNTFDKKHFEKYFSKWAKNTDQDGKAHLIWAVVGWMDENDQEVVLDRNPIPHRVIT